MEEGSGYGQFFLYRLNKYLSKTLKFIIGMASVEISTTAIQKEKSSKFNLMIIGYLVYTTLVPMELPGRNHLRFKISASTFKAKYIL